MTPKLKRTPACCCCCFSILTSLCQTFPLSPPKHPWKSSVLTQTTLELGLHGARFQCFRSLLVRWRGLGRGLLLASGGEVSGMLLSKEPTMHRTDPPKRNQNASGSQLRSPDRESSQAKQRKLQALTGRKLHTPLPIQGHSSQRAWVWVENLYCISTETS